MPDQTTPAVPINPTKLTFEEWETRFKPVKNHLDPNASYNGTMFETFGDDLAFVHDCVDNNTVWTITSSGDYDVLGDGYHYIDRMGYFITEIPCPQDENYEIILSEPRFSAVFNHGFGYAIVDSENPGRSIVWVDEAFHHASSIAETIADALNLANSEDELEFNLSHEEDEDVTSEDA